MRILLTIYTVLLLIGCGGTLSEEQRHQIREERKKREIKRVTEPQLTEAAFEEGRRLVGALEKLGSDSMLIDSALEAHGGRIRFITPGGEVNHILEQQLIDAYLASGVDEEVDNVQILRDASGRSTDSLLYTKPVIVHQPDGIDRLVGVWNIWLSRKEIVLNMDSEE